MEKKLQQMKTHICGVINAGWFLALQNIGHLSTDWGLVQSTITCHTWQLLFGSTGENQWESGKGWRPWVKFQLTLLLACDLVAKEHLGWVAGVKLARRGTGWGTGRTGDSILCGVMPPPNTLLTHPFFPMQDFLTFLGRGLRVPMRREFWRPLPSPRVVRSGHSILSHGYENLV